MKRIFDLCFSLLFVILLIPIFLIIIILYLIIEGSIDIIYYQQRIGKNESEFLLYKFRSMSRNKQNNLQLTVGNNDNRITKLGKILRKYKIDELPQIFNILKGDMSFVGPRPEVKKYVDMYNDKQKKVLTVKPGLTDYASIEYINENELLSQVENPEEYYIKEIMPKKLELNLKYIENQSFILDIKLIFNTIFGIIIK